MAAADRHGICRFLPEEERTGRPRTTLDRSPGIEPERIPSLAVEPTRLDGAAFYLEKRLTGVDQRVHELHWRHGASVPARTCRGNGPAVQRSAPAGRPAAGLRALRRLGGDFAGRSKTAAMPRIEVSRTLVKSPPELWAELGPERLELAVGAVSVEETEPERSIAFRGAGVHGTAVLEPAGWGTKVTLTAETEEQVANLGFWTRLRGAPLPGSQSDLEERLNELLDTLGSAHKRPFSRE